jgi:hypothetical protein
MSLRVKLVRATIKKRGFPASYPLGKYQTSFKWTNLNGGLLRVQTAGDRDKTNAHSLLAQLPFLKKLAGEPIMEQGLEIKLLSK